MKKEVVDTLKKYPAADRRRAVRISELISDYLAARKMTGKALADAAGIAGSYVSQMRTGLNRPNAQGEKTPVDPSLSQLVALAHAMQMTTPELVAKITLEPLTSAKPSADTGKKESYTAQAVASIMDDFDTYLAGLDGAEWYQIGRRFAAADPRTRQIVSLLLEEKPTEKAEFA